MSNFKFEEHGKRAKERALQGLKGFNKGLSTFSTLDKYIYGLRRETQIVLFGETKSGKSTICNQMLYNALVANQRLENPYKIYINYWSLEMTGESLFQRFMSMYIYEKYRKIYSPTDLEGYTDYKITEELIHKYYDEAIEFVSKIAYYNVLDIPHKVSDIEKYLDHYHKQLGKTVNDRYIYNDPATFTINVIDHMKLLSPGSEGDEFARADALSKAFFRSRNKYGDTNILLNQANSEIAKSERANTKHEPILSDLYGGKGVEHDADLVLGIAFPFCHKVENYYGYNIKQLRNEFRALHILASRFGDMGIMVPLHTSFLVQTVKELPNDPKLIDYKSLIVKR